MLLANTIFLHCMQVLRGLLPVLDTAHVAVKYVHVQLQPAGCNGHTSVIETRTCEEAQMHDDHGRILATNGASKLYPQDLLQNVSAPSDMLSPRRSIFLLWMIGLNPWKLCAYIRLRPDRADPALSRPSPPVGRSECIPVGRNPHTEAWPKLPPTCGPSFSLAPRFIRGSWSAPPARRVSTEAWALTKRALSQGQPRQSAKDKCGFISALRQ